MTRGKINSRGIIVDYDCAGVIGGVIAPFELIGYSAFMLKSCEFLQHEVDAITYRQGLPFTHADGTLYKLSEYPDSAYYKEQKEDQMNRLLFLDQLLKKYRGRRIEDYDYEAIQEAKEMKEKGEKKGKTVEPEAMEVKTTKIKEYPPCCDVIKVK